MEEKSGNSIIASAGFIACRDNDEEWDMTVRIYAPEPDPESATDYRCRVEIAGFLEPVFAYGVDSLQALGLALATVRRDIEQLQDEGWEFFHSANDHEPIMFSFLYCGDQSAAPWLQQNQVKE